MFRPSQLRGNISNPRLSTFRHIPTKATPQALQAPSVIQEKSATSKATTVELPDKVHLAKGGTQARVSIRYHLGRPSLHLRLSTFEMPSPATFAEQIKARRESSGARSVTKVKEIKLQSRTELSPPQASFHRLSHSVFRDSVVSTLSSYAPVEVELVSAPRRTLSQRSARAKLYQAKALPATSKEPLCSETTVVDPRDLSRGQSTKSIPDSLRAVQDLAGQFPGPPTTFGDQIIPPPIPQALGSPSQLRSEWVTSIHSSDTLSDNKSFSSSRRTLYNVTGTSLRSSSLYQVKPYDPFKDDQVDVPSSSRTPFVDNRMAGAPPEARTKTKDFKLATVTALNIVKSRPSKPKEPRISSIAKKDFFSGNSRNSRNSTALNGPNRGNLKHIVIPPRPLDTPEILNEDDVGNLESFRL